MNSIYIVSLGCNKNLVDSEIMIGMLVNAGHKIVYAPNEAEVIIINTCGFITDAKQEAINTIFEMLKYKPGCRAVIATGCLAERYHKQLLNDIPELDGLMGVYQYDRICECVKLALEGKRPVFIGGNPGYLDQAAHSRVLATPPYTAYLKISEGCDNRCHYCAIPGIRGKNIPRSFKSLMREAEKLRASGVKELNITAQDITTYSDQNIKLFELVKALDSLDFKWIRLLYAYPGRLTDKLLDYMNSSPSVCNYLDIPIQHTQSRMLSAMNRHYSQKDITALYKRIRAYNNGWALRTTVMVGYPGEASRDYSAMLDYITLHPFDHLGAFIFSPEEDTVAYSLTHKVRPSTAQYRLDGIMLRQGEISHRLNQARIGGKYQMLIEGYDSQSKQYYGRCSFQGPDVDGKTFIESPCPLSPGDMKDIIINDAFAYDLYAQPINKCEEL